MYQPKIRDELITRLYHLAKARKIPMTRLVNSILENGIVRIEASAENVNDTPTIAYHRRRQRKGGADGHTT